MLVTQILIFPPLDYILKTIVKVFDASDFCFACTFDGAGRYNLRASHPDLKVEARGSTEVWCFSSLASYSVLF